MSVDPLGCTIPLTADCTLEREVPVEKNNSANAGGNPDENVAMATWVSPGATWSRSVTSTTTFSDCCHSAGDTELLPSTKNARSSTDARHGSGVGASVGAAVGEVGANVDGAGVGAAVGNNAVPFWQMQLQRPSTQLMGSPRLPGHPWVAEHAQFHSHPAFSPAAA